MIDTAIATALITAAASVLCQIMIQRTAVRQSRAEQDKNLSLIVYRLEQLERAVARQSAALERLSIAEERIKAIERTRTQ